MLRSVYSVFILLFITISIAPGASLTAPGAVGLSGSDSSIPPSRPGALRVQTAGVVSTGTGTVVAAWPGLPNDTFLLLSPIHYNESSRLWKNIAATSGNLSSADASKAPALASDNVSFDGSSDVMSGTTQASWGGDVTVIIKMSMPSYTDSRVFVIDSVPTLSQYIVWYPFSGELRFQWASGSVGEVTARTDFARTFCVTIPSSGSPGIWVDGVDTATSAQSIDRSTVPLSGKTIYFSLDGKFFNGRIYGFAVVPRIMSQDEIVAATNATWMSY